MKKLVRDICTSRTYQLASASNASNRDDDAFFSHAKLRRLRADVLLDSISSATGVITNFGSYPTGFRALQLYEGNRRSGNYFLKTFGISSRDSVNVSETRLEPTLAQTLHLINGDTIEGKIGRSTVVSELLAQKKSPDVILDNLYIRTLARKPTDGERKKLNPLIATNAGDRKPYDDIF